MSDNTARALDFMQELSDDVADADRQRRTTDSQSARRAYTRAVFAAVEGNANSLKLEVLDEQGEPRRDVTFAELAMLREESYAVNANGEAYAQPRFIRTEDNLVFALRMYMRDFGLDSHVDRSGAGWNAFKAALKIRHRITHPRRIDDLAISDEEIRNVELAYGWFTQTLAANLRAVNEHLKAQLEKYREQE